MYRNRSTPDPHLPSSSRSAPKAAPQPMPQPTATPKVPKEIFKAYDIRGVVGSTLTEDGMRLIGRALGSEARVRGQKAIAVGRDGRLSGPALSLALTEGL